MTMPICLRLPLDWHISNALTLGLFKFREGFPIIHLLIVLLKDEISTSEMVDVGHTCEGISR